MDKFIAGRAVPVGTVGGMTGLVDAIPQRSGRPGNFFSQLVDVFSLHVDDGYNDCDPPGEVIK